MTERRRGLVAVLLLLAFTCFLFWPLISGVLTRSPRFLEWDVPEQYWPDQVYLCQALHDGELPLWNPYDRAGYPYYADPQSGAYHPVNWSLCVLGGSSPGLGWVELRVVLGFFMAGVFGLLWLRRWKVPWGPAVLGAVVIQAAPFMRHNWELNLTTALAYLPLMLWAADRAVVERRLSDGVVLALAIALGAWVGSPPALWLCLSFVGPFALYRLIAAVRTEGRRILGPALITLSVALVATAGLIAVVVIPALGLADHSVQAGRSYASIAKGGLAPSDLQSLVWPRPGNHLYVGLLALLLAPLAFIRRGSLPARWFFAVMALLAVGLSLGQHGPLFKLAYDWVPGVSLFRLPHRYEAWLGPALGALSAAGLAWLVSNKPTSWVQHHAKWVRISASGAMAVGLVWAAFLPGWGPAAVFIGAGVIGWAMLLPRLGASHLAVGGVLAALLLLDVAQRLPPERHTVAGSCPVRTKRSNAHAVVSRAKGTNHHWRYFDEFGVSCRSGTRLCRRDLRGYQDPLLLKSHERVLASLRASPRLAEQFGVRYALTGPHFIHGWNRHYLPPPKALLRIPGSIDRGQGVIELPNPLPAAYWVPQSQVIRASSRPRALALVKQLAPRPLAILDGVSTGADARRSLAGLSPARSTPHLPSTPHVAAHSYRLERSRLSFRIHAPGPGMVVINETWYPGWKAYVDGKEVAVYRANGLVRAIFVKQGHHRVTLEFRPTDGLWLRWLLLLTLIACLALLAGSAWFRQKRLAEGRAERRAERRADQG